MIERRHPQAEHGSTGTARSRGELTSRRHLPPLPGPFRGYWASGIRRDKPTRQHLAVTQVRVMLNIGKTKSNLSMKLDQLTKVDVPSYWKGYHAQKLDGFAPNSFAEGKHSKQHMGRLFSGERLREVLCAKYMSFVEVFSRRCCVKSTVIRSARVPENGEQNVQEPGMPSFTDTRPETSPSGSHWAGVLRVWGPWVWKLDGVV